MKKHRIMDAEGINRTIKRLSHEITERIIDSQNIVLIGIKNGGEIVAERIKKYLASKGIDLPCIGIDISLKRDDLVSEFFVPKYDSVNENIVVEGKTVVLCDDVLHSGRTVRAAIEEIFTMGRPNRILLLEFIDRGGRQLPVRADFVGKNLPTAQSEFVYVNFVETGSEIDEILIGKEC